MRGEVCALIGMVCYGGPELRLPVSQLVDMLGITVALEFQQALSDRGDIRVSGERFDNHGPVIRREVRLMGVGAALEVAELLCGGVERQADRFIMRFDRGSSFKLSRFVFDVELASLEVAADLIRVRFTQGPEVRIHLSVPEPVGDA
jgi:hypothetical protein